jgi:hypothetical protein
MVLRNESGDMLGAKALGETVYEYDYFSGSQITVMFGDVVIDSAVAIRYGVQQSKTPIFGYANQYYSFLADGHVLIQGSLTIAFKEAGYLLYPIQRFANNDADIALYGDTTGEEHLFSNSPRYSLNSDGYMDDRYSPTVYSLTEASRAAKDKEVMRANVEQMKDWEFRGGPGGNPRAQQRYNKFWQELQAMPDNRFEDWAEEFEDAIWYGSDKSNPIVRDKLFSRNITPGTEIQDEDVLQHRRADQYPEMDIWIVYGDMSRQPANHTVKKLLDVSFIGQSQTIEISGQPTYEQYEFIARNLV